MNPDTGRFIGLAIRPLGDNAELRLLAEAELRKSLEESAGNPEALAAMSASLARADRHPGRHRWRVALLVMTALVSLPLLGHTAWQYHAIRDLGGINALYDSTIANNPDLGPPQKLVLSGAIRAGNPTDRWKPLWESQPENPSYLAEYALAYYKDHGELSPEILATAEKIDPDNGWFPALAAAGIATGAVTKENIPYKQRQAGVKTPPWKIDDGNRLRDSLSAIHRFAGKARFTGYSTELLKQRIPLLPPRRDFVSQIPLVLFMSDQNSTNVPFLKLADVLAAGTRQCAADGDVAGFRQLVGDWKYLVGATSKDGVGSGDVLVAKVIFAGPAANFRDSAQALDLKEEAAYFAGIHDRWQEEVAARNKRGKTVTATEDFAIRHGAILGSVIGIPGIGNQVKSPPVLTADDLLPARYADHAFFARLCSWPAWALLGICAGMTALTGFRRGPLVRVLSGRMIDLLHLSDWAWTIGGGIVFPVGWYFCITRLTSLSAREWSLEFSNLIQPAGQFGCMALSMVFLPGVIANWRLSKRGAAIGFEGRSRWIGWTMAAAALAGVPVLGSAGIREGLGEETKYQALFASATAGVWFLAGFAHLLFGRKSPALRRATLARIVRPVWVLGMLVLAALTPFHYAEERRWIGQDGIYKISSGFPGDNRYEHDVTRILRDELLEMTATTGSMR